MSPSVLWVGEQGSNALTYYRQVVPGTALEKAGWEVRYAPILMEMDTGFLTGLRPGFPPAPVPDVLICRHLVDPTGATEMDSSALIAAARARGQRVFYDLDDDVWDLPEENPASRFYTPGQLRVLTANLNACDGVLVSTPVLARVIRRRLRGVPVHVCPNGILVDPFRVSSRRRPLRLGWLGLMDFRSADLEMIASELRAVLAGRTDVEFVHLGHHESRDDISSVLGDMPVRRVDWARFDALPDSLDHIDAAIVPMRDNALNASRSPTTGLALAAAGKPVLASGLPAYVDLAGRVPGVYVITNDNWETGLGRFLDAAALGDLPDGYTMRAAVARQYGPEAVAGAWFAAIGTEATVPDWARTATTFGRRLHDHITATM